MGSPDQHGSILVVFCACYFAIITIFLGLIDPNTINDRHTLTISGQNSSDYSSCDCGTLTCSEYRLIYGQVALDQLCDNPDNEKNTFIGNVITNLKDLGAWNLVIFSPLIIGLGYIALVLFVPTWV